MRLSLRSCGKSPSGRTRVARSQYAARTGALQPITDVGSCRARTIPFRESILVDEIARQRMRQASVGKGLSGKKLPKRQPAAIERMRGPGHVDAPDAEFLFADFRARGVGVALQPLDPVPKRLPIMLT